MILSVLTQTRRVGGFVGGIVGSFIGKAIGFKQQTDSHVEEKTIKI